MEVLLRHVFRLPLVSPTSSADTAPPMPRRPASTDGSSYRRTGTRAETGLPRPMDRQWPADVQWTVLRPARWSKAPRRLNAPAFRRDHGRAIYDRLAEIDQGAVVEHKRLGHVLQVAQAIQAQRDNRRISGCPAGTNQGQPVRATERAQGTKKQRCANWTGSRSFTTSPAASPHPGALRSDSGRRAQASRAFTKAPLAARFAR